MLLVVFLFTAEASAGAIEVGFFFGFPWRLGTSIGYFAASPRPIVTRFSLSPFFLTSAQVDIGWAFERDSPTKHLLLVGANYTSTCDMKFIALTVNYGIHWRNLLPLMGAWWVLKKPDKFFLPNMQIGYHPLLGTG